MMQRQPNPTELESMDSYIQILCRFQKSKQKVPPSSFLTKIQNRINKKSEKEILLNTSHFMYGSQNSWMVVVFPTQIFLMVVVFPIQIF